MDIENLNIGNGFIIVDTVRIHIIRGGLIEMKFLMEPFTGIPGMLQIGTITIDWIILFMMSY